MRPNPVYSIIAVRTAQASAAAFAGHLALGWPLTGPHAVGLWLTPALCLYFLFVFVGHWTWGLPILARLPGKGRQVALTFDDGPTETTVRILDILTAHGVHATFFVLGERVDQRPDIVRRIVAEGHTLALHGFAHAPYVLPNWNHVRRDIDAVRAAVSRAVPDALPAVWVRPPHGFKTLLLPFLLRRLGLRMAAWSVNSRDYDLTDPACIARRVLALAQPGAILLLHDGPGNAATADALPFILDGLRAQDLCCVPLGQ